MKTVTMNQTIRALALTLTSLALAACPPGGNTPDGGGNTPDASGALGAAFCAKTRALGCDGAANCTQFINPVASGVPAACVAQWNAFIGCLDSSAPTLTCSALNTGGSMPSICVPQYSAAAQCASSQQEAGTNTDASTETDSGVRPVPDPNMWPSEGNVTVNIYGVGEGVSFAPGTASMGIGPIGTPSNAHIFSFSTSSMSLGGSIDCRVGFLHDSAAQAWTFSSDAQLTQTCEVTGGSGMQSLTFTNARVEYNSFGSLMVAIEMRGTGAFSGTGRIEVVYPSP